MRDEWYGDKRDLVKWGVLVQLAWRYSVKHILQVLYYRPTIWGHLEIEGAKVKLPESVLQQFRRTGAISALQCPARIEVVQEHFRERTKYLQLVLQKIRLRTQVPGIVFLDPDTGLEPAVAGPKHVLESELISIWQAMKTSDVLVFYQHQTNRNNTPWIEPKRLQFEGALRLEPGSAKVASGVEIAKDVVFFFCQKRDQDANDGLTNVSR